MPVITNVFTPESDTPNASAKIVNIPASNEYAEKSFSSNVTFVISATVAIDIIYSVPISSFSSAVIVSGVSIIASPSIPAAEIISFE